MGELVGILDIEEASEEKIICKHDKLNIAMIGHKRIPSREGGVEIVVDELATRLAKQGHRVTAYNRTGTHVSGKLYEDKDNIDIRKEKKYKGVNLINVLTIDKAGIAALTSSISATIHAILSCIRKSSRYDCIHYHAEGPSAMVWLPHMLGIRTVVTIHGLDWKRAKWGGFATKYLKFGERMVAKYADEVIVLSKNVQDYFKTTYGRETVFIPNGIERPEIRQANEIKKKWDLEKDSYILYLGRIVPEKGLHYLIEAFKNVDTNKKLVIAGGASDTSEYMYNVKKIAKEDERIIFTNFVQGRVLEELYSNCFLYCLPSDLEGMPISLLEAMSYGNCCVTSNIPECAEVLEENGVLFKKSDIKHLRDRIQEKCNEAEVVQNYKSNAADYICKKYNWDDVVNKTIDLYSK